MHEMSVAAAIHEQVLAVAKQNNLTQVTEVRLRIGQLRLIVPEALSLAWEAIREGSIASKASLAMVEVPARARCKACNQEYQPEWPVFLCPNCGKANVEILTGEELVLEQITGDTQGPEIGTQ